MPVQVPFNEIVVEFLNRHDKVSLKRQGRDPKTFLEDAYKQIDSVFTRGPSGTTPALEKFQGRFAPQSGVAVSRYFFGDGVPNVSGI